MAAFQFRTGLLVLSTTDVYTYIYNYYNILYIIVVIFIVLYVIVLMCIIHNKNKSESLPIVILYPRCSMYGIFAYIGSKMAT